MKKIPIIGGVITLVVGIGLSRRMIKKNLQKKVQKIDNENKFKDYYYMLNHWLMLKQSGVEIKQYFNDREYKRIAIYGYGEMGKRVIDELKSSDICIECVIDKNLTNNSGDIKFVGVDEEWPDIDAIIVTPIYAYEQILVDYSNKTSAEFVSLEDIIYSC